MTTPTMAEKLAAKKNSKPAEAAVVAEKPARPRGPARDRETLLTEAKADYDRLKAKYDRLLGDLDRRIKRLEAEAPIDQAELAKLVEGKSPEEIEAEKKKLRQMLLALGQHTKTAASEPAASDLGAEPTPAADQPEA